MEKYTGINRFLKSDALQTLLDKNSDGTYREVLDDWKWIFSFSAQYKGYIFFYVVLGIVSSTFGLAAAWLGRVMINIIVGYQYERIGFLVGGNVVVDGILHCVPRTDEQDIRKDFCTGA